jgi:hypothetical protein
MGKTNGGMNYRTISRVDVPNGRRGKHHDVVARVLSDVSKLRNGQAIRIPITELGDSKENLRAALNRAMRKEGVRLETAADEKFLYVWRGASPIPAKVSPEDDRAQKGL